MAPFEKQQRLLARHLEVFVPKPSTRRLEQNLRDWLDRLLSEATILRDAPPTIERHLPAEIRTILEGREYWENIVYGYSTYETDGHFVTPSMGPRRLIDDYFREGTVAIKFILTNYQTRVPQSGVDMVSADAIAESLLTEQPEASRRNELLHLACADLHYDAVSAHIIRGIMHSVLWKENEVWAHAWYTALDRWHRKNGGPQPLVSSVEEKKQRFGPKWERVICATDYRFT